MIAPVWSDAPVDADALRAATAMLERLKNFEFALYRSVGLGADGRPAAGARAAAPAEYRALVEEYYRVLAGSKRRP